MLKDKIRNAIGRSELRRLNSSNGAQITDLLGFVV
jgi:hypothetical protein